MFKLLRYFSITSLLVTLVASALSGYFYQKWATKDIISAGENQNIALAQSFSNTLWSEFSDLLTSSSEWEADTLRSHPKTALLKQAALGQMEHLDVIKVKIYDLNGKTIFSTDTKQIGELQQNNAGYLKARNGTVASQITKSGEIYSFEGDLFNRDILISYLPIRTGGYQAPIEGVFELYSDVTPLVDRTMLARQKVILGTILMGGLLYSALFLIVRRADKIIQQQEIERNQYTAQIENANETLELRVDKRTLQLSNINKQLNREMGERKKAEEILRVILKGTSSLVGEEFLLSLVRLLATSFDMCCAFISEVVEGRAGMVRIIAMWEDGHYRDSFEYDVEGLPCERVISQERLTFYPAGVQQILPSGSWLKEFRVESYLAIPLVNASGGVMGHLGVMSTRPMKYTMPVDSILKIFGARAIAEVERKQTEATLTEQATRDALTGLYNRRYFNIKATEAITTAQRTNSTLALLVCDLDHFKAINDSFGHPAGDEVLKTVSSGIMAATRGADLQFRWGGDEFVIILLGTTRKGAIITANRIRKSIQSIKRQEKSELDLSIGISLYPEHSDNIEGLIKLADQALYIAKKDRHKVHLGMETTH